LAERQLLVFAETPSCAPAFEIAQIAPKRQPGLWQFATSYAGRLQGISGNSRMTEWSRKNLIGRPSSRHHGSREVSRVAWPRALQL